MKNRLEITAIIALVIFIFLTFIPYLSKYIRELKETREAEKQEEESLRQEEYIQKEKLYLTGQFDPAKKDGFVLVGREHSANLYPMYLRKETYEAFIKMYDAAKEDGIELRISSGARNFYSQKNLWDTKWKGLEGLNDQAKFRKILEYMAVPGASRHHWGTDIDINGAKPAYFTFGRGQAEYEWLVKNAERFGFCQTYNAKGTERPVGYNEEKWHWSYLPLARFFTKEYTRLVTNEDIKGFLGDEYVESFNVINNYALSINPDCV